MWVLQQVRLVQRRRRTLLSVQHGALRRQCLLRSLFLDGHLATIAAAVLATLATTMLD